ncbi:MAG: class I SAM-dependent methyltransferase [Burkholderiales bacterium]
MSTARNTENATEKQKARYDSSYFSAYRNDPKREAMYVAERARIKKLKPSGGRILDVGCGLGGFLAGFAPEQWQRHGVEISEMAAGEARKAGIQVNDFAKAYDYPDEYFDVITFRGSLQLIPTPFAVIQTCIKLLVPGGILVFLATPNSNSPYYRRFKTLPFLTPHGNFLIPSDIMMRNALQNFGLRIIEISYPYLETPYARPISDHLKFLMSYFGIRKKFAFWKSSMEIYSEKPR